MCALTKQNIGFFQKSFKRKPQQGHYELFQIITPK